MKFEKIIIGQRHAENLEGIKKMISENLPELLEKCIFTSSPSTLVEQGRISGKSMMIIGTVYENSMRGSEIAERVKQFNSEAQIFQYSTCPQDSDYFDGTIYKRDGTCHSGEHAAIIDFLQKNKD